MSSYPLIRPPWVLILSFLTFLLKNLYLKVSLVCVMSAGCVTTLSLGGFTLFWCVRKYLVSVFSERIVYVDVYSSISLLLLWKLWIYYSVAVLSWWRGLPWLHSTKRQAYNFSKKMVDDYSNTYNLNLTPSLSIIINFNQVSTYATRVYKSPYLLHSIRSLLFAQS